MAATAKKSNSSLLVIVLDASPLAWGTRQLRRDDQDKKRAQAGKRSVGPAVLPEVLNSLQAFCVAATSIERSCGLIVLAVCDNESAVVHPRKNQLAAWLGVAGDSYTADTRRLQRDLLSGVAELCQCAAAKAPLTTDPAARQAGMAAAVSKALCLINRFHVAAQTGYGISALNSSHYMERVTDEGVIALMGSKSSSGSGGAKQAANKSAWNTRILLLQVSDDRSRDYNAFMNCAFSAAKHHVVMDGCFLPAGGAGQPTSSSFLEQACDLTGGVFLAPKMAAQVGGALTEMLLTVFLAPLAARPQLNLPALNKVDFRASCFETGEIVDMAHVCNQCLSIFKTMPTGPQCPTCQATILK